MPNLSPQTGTPVNINSRFFFFYQVFQLGPLICFSLQIHGSTNKNSISQTVHGIQHQVKEQNHGKSSFKKSLNT